MFRYVFKSLIFVLLLFLSHWAYAISLLPSYPLYLLPDNTELHAHIEALSCYDLDMAINKLYPYRSSYKPNFYSDSANKAASITFMFNPSIAMGYWVYSSLVAVKDHRRIATVNEQINALQQLKAAKFCDI